MPKRPRKIRLGQMEERRGKTRKAVEERPITALARPVQEQDRCHCPLCGMMVDVDNFERGPFEVDLFRQRYGGRLPHSKDGYMEYIPLDSGLLATLQKEIIRPAIFRLREKYGI